MDRLEPDERAQGETASAQELITLDEWDTLGRPENRELRLSCEDSLDGAYAALARSRRIVIEFPAFTDGRGFSHARCLRAQGFEGDLLAAGDVLPDQWSYLERCGFSDIADPALRAASSDQPRFRHGYQADELSSVGAVVRS